jgi:cytoskeletal protein CcmA (bactofilin family)
MDASVDRTQSAQSSGRAPGLLGPGLALDGEIVTGEDIVFEGRLNGGLHAPEHAVTIGPKGSVRGRIFARLVLIEGTVNGDVTATGLIEIAEHARVEADLNAPSIAIAQGAFVVGKVDMRRTEAAARVAKYRIDKGAEARGTERTERTATVSG